MRIVICSRGLQGGKSPSEVVNVSSVGDDLIEIGSIIETINTQIDKLKELRKTLINDVVTGKIKVYQEGV